MGFKKTPLPRGGIVVQFHGGPRDGEVAVSGTTIDGVDWAEMVWDMSGGGQIGRAFMGATPDSLPKLLGQEPMTGPLVAHRYAVERTEPDGEQMLIHCQYEGTGDRPKPSK